MIKIKLIKNKNLEKLEEEVNSFLKGKLPLEVNIQEGPSLQYLASILYKDLGKLDGFEVGPVSSIPKVETVPLKQNENPSTPFDRMSMGLSPTKED